MAEWRETREESTSEGESSGVAVVPDVLNIPDSEIVDAFPSKVFDVDEFCELRQLMVCSTTPETMKTCKMDAIPVIPFKMEYCHENDDNRVYQRIVFLNLIEDRTLLSDRFDRLYDNAAFRNPRTGHEDVDWIAMDNKLLKSPRISHRMHRLKTNKSDGRNRKGNVDNRQSFVYRHHHLVKSHLTNGARTTFHYDLYIVFSVPLLIYQQKSGMRAPDGSFYAMMRRDFEPYLLSPIGAFTIYVVMPGTTYLTVSLQKTCFCIVRVTEAAFSQLQKHYDIYHAFDPMNLFRPKPRAELEALSKNNSFKRKRGRPAKALDKMYWYKDTTPTPSNPMDNSYQLVVAEYVVPTTAPATPSTLTTDEVARVRADLELTDEEEEEDSDRTPKRAKSETDAASPTEQEISLGSLGDIDDSFLKIIKSAEASSVQVVDDVVRICETEQQDTYYAGAQIHRYLNSYFEEDPAELLSMPAW